MAIITASDKGAKSLREDLSGPCIKQIVEESDYKVVSMEILPDDRALLADKMIELADKGAVVVGQYHITVTVS